VDGRGGSTGAAPAIFRDHISVPTIAALARARKFLDAAGCKKGAKDGVTLIITGGLRTPADFIKALALGADGIALANSAIQAIGCIGARVCGSGDCPAGIATHAEHLVNKIDIEARSRDLALFFTGSLHLMQIMARACGHSALQEFALDDLSTWKSEMARLSGVRFAGVGEL
jgi:methylamine---glutamate N-methyltransferase subunit C